MKNRNEILFNEDKTFSTCSYINKVYIYFLKETFILWHRRFVNTKKLKHIWAFNKVLLFSHLLYQLAQIFVFVNTNYSIDNPNLFYNYCRAGSSEGSKKPKNVSKNNLLNIPTNFLWPLSQKESMQIYYLSSTLSTIVSLVSIAFELSWSVSKKSWQSWHLVRSQWTLDVSFEFWNIRLLRKDRCQDKIPNAKIPNVTKYPKYTQYFILTLKLSERLFSIIFSKCVWPRLAGHGHASAARGTWYETITTEHGIKLATSNEKTCL